MRLRIFIALLGFCVLAGTRASNAGSAASVTLVWTTPGDDGMVGVPAQYDLRYSDHPINSGNFTAAVRVPFVPKPIDAGTLQSCSVGGLSPGQAYYFALKTADEKGNWSQLSNIAYYDGRSVTVIENAPISVSFSSPWPNPAQTFTRFSFTLTGRAAMQIDAYDAMGRRIRTLVNGSQDPGYHELTWDLTDSAGKPIGGGVYFVVAQAGNQRFQKRVIVAR